MATMALWADVSIIPKQPESDCSPESVGPGEEVEEPKGLEHEENPSIAHANRARY